MAAADPTREALAFDVYGTLVDPIAIGRRLGELMPADDAARVAALWRQKQLECTWRVNVMERYEDFEALTRKALGYALAVVGNELDDAATTALMSQYGELDSFDDVEPGLARLGEAGYSLSAFSNGTPRMLAAVLASSGLERHFNPVISVDEVGIYKPSPLVYRHAAQRLRRPVDEVRLVSSNPFDDLGAHAVGMQTAWIARSGGPFDPLGPPPGLVVANLTELADALA